MKLLLVVLLFPIFAYTQTITIKGEMDCPWSNAVITWDTAGKDYKDVWVQRRGENEAWETIDDTTGRNFNNTGYHKQYIRQRYYYRVYADGYYSNVVMLEPCNFHEDAPTKKEKTEAHIRRGIYDIQGRKIKSLPSVHGMYIVDSKKILVR